MSSTHCSCFSCVQHENDPPSLSHFRNITPEEANIVAGIDLDVLCAHNAIIKLHEFQAACKRQRNAFVPAVKLPPEVLATIFEFACCPDGDVWVANMHLPSQVDRYGNECPVNASAVTPLFIGAICSAWRSIAWGAPQLWNSISLLYDDHNAETLAKMLDYWLSKSGQLPLSVTLAEDEPEFFPSAYTSVKVIEVIAAYAHRLHTVDLFLPGKWEPALIRIARCAPLLTRLTLRMSGNAHRQNPSIELGDLFANASQLREVTLFGYCTVDVMLPWAQLESLESAYDYITNFVETFHLCPRLRRFSGYIGDMSWRVAPSVITTHTTLEALEISGFYEDLHSGLFKMLELPALRSFTLNIDTRPPEWSSWLAPFVLRVAKTLETLHLFPAAPLNEELLPILQIVPRLRKLLLLNSFPGLRQERTLCQTTLDLMNPTKYELLECERIEQLDGEGGGDEAGTAGLDGGSNRHCLVPNLETFEYEGEVDFTAHALVEFLIARWRGRSNSSCRTAGLDLESRRQQLEGPKTQTAHEPRPPNVDVPSTRLRSATFKIRGQIQFGDADAELIQELRLEGMQLEFSGCSH